MNRKANDMNRIPVYFMPGLAASSQIFERIVLPAAIFETVLLEWEIPVDNESLVHYAERMAQKITHDSPVLVGVSFGGILVQEMSRFIDVRKVVIISSVKNCEEFPLKFKIAKTTKAYKLIPTTLFANIEALSHFSFGPKINQKLKLYEKFLRVRDKQYLDWAVEQIILWPRAITDPKVIHIHGDQDDVFPSKNIQDFIVVKGGTHAMILVKYKWFNEHLPKIILE
jgi:pimeloyl-ACP methyl ester carboxylesterase